MEAIQTEKERREKFTPRMDQLTDQFKRGLLTVDEFADEIAIARFAAWQ